VESDLTVDGLVHETDVDDDSGSDDAEVMLNKGHGDNIEQA
jgi:hypothetical protein